MVTITLKSLEQKRDEISRIEDQTSPNFKECQAKHLEIDVCVCARALDFQS